MAVANALREKQPGLRALDVSRDAEVIGILLDDETIIRLAGAFGLGLGPGRHHASLFEANDEWPDARR